MLVKLQTQKTKRKILGDKKVNNFKIEISNLFLLKNDVRYKVQNKVIEIKDNDDIKIRRNRGKALKFYKN